MGHGRPVPTGSTTGLATRYEKRTVNYRAMVVTASIVIWLESRFVTQTLVTQPPITNIDEPVAE